MKKLNLVFTLLFALYAFASCAQKPKTGIKATAFKTGAEQTEVYLPLLKRKRVAIL